MKRSKHSLSHYKLLTANMGDLVPVACYEVLPGDSIQQATSVLLRVSPLLAPVMHPVQVRIHHWFVPNRLTWNNYNNTGGNVGTWEDFITGGEDGMGNGANWPKVNAAPQVKGSLADYFGLPLGVPLGEVSLLPLMGYNLIFDEHYRDADLVPKKSGSADADLVAKVAWEKDYFTTARPWPQKGPDVSLPLGTRAPVKGIGLEGTTWTAGPQAVTDSEGAASYANYQWMNVTAGARQAIEKNPSANLPNIYADLTNATATNINDVRRAFALQRYQEARAQYGHRYQEYLAFLGVRSSDARLQRPEYLGGGKATISFSEVLKTGAGEDPAEPIGAMKGHGISAMRSRRFRRFFEEHGLVFSLLSVRPRVMYEQGVERMWTRKLKEDYWQRELELIGQQEVLAKEIFVTGTPATDDATWGYSDRYSEYRHLRSTISGDFRDTLDFWHMARMFATPPVLNEAFVQCDPTKRINAEQTQHNLWIMCNHSIQARRLVTKKTIGRII